MQIILNGQIKEIKEESTMLDLLNELNIKQEAIVAEINLDIPEKDQYARIILQENDKIELIRFLGGG